jgi:hypothetical protein
MKSRPSWKHRQWGVTANSDSWIPTRVHKQLPALYWPLYSITTQKMWTSLISDSKKAEKTILLGAWKMALHHKVVFRHEKNITHWHYINDYPWLHRQGYNWGTGFLKTKQKRKRQQALAMQRKKPTENNLKLRRRSMVIKSTILLFQKFQ